MCGDYNLRREKRYVEVDVRFTPDGCFTCLICGQKRNLWLEQGKWFVEAYCSVPESRAS